jgi:hypothetical protein
MGCEESAVKERDSVNTPATPAGKYSAAFSDHLQQQEAQLTTPVAASAELDAAGMSPSTLESNASAPTFETSDSAANSDTDSHGSDQDRSPRATATVDDLCNGGVTAPDTFGMAGATTVVGGSAGAVFTGARNSGDEIIDTHALHVPLEPDDNHSDGAKTSCDSSRSHLTDEDFLREEGIDVQRICEEQLNTSVHFGSESDNSLDKLYHPLNGQRRGTDASSWRSGSSSGEEAARSSDLTPTSTPSGSPVLLNFDNSTGFSAAVTPRSRGQQDEAARIASSSTDNSKKDVSGRLDK